MWLRFCGWVTSNMQGEVDRKSLKSPVINRLQDSMQECGLESQTLNPQSQKIEDSWFVHFASK